MPLRPATAADAPVIATLVEEAYERYVPRIGRRPAPMDADHRAAAVRGGVTVLEEDGGIVGVLEVVVHADHLLVENVAVAPAHQGRGHGRTLLAAAEALAARSGLPELRLYTNEAMTENVALYRRLGWTETGRSEHDGFRRVFFAKPAPTRG